MDEKENENKKNAKIFYLTLAVVLSIVVILVIATTVARRTAPINEPSDTQPPVSDDTNDKPTISNTDKLPEFSSPISLGVIGMDYSDTLPVFSQTMNDYRAHLGVDVMAELGSDVLAVADGTVTNVWDDPFMGKCVSIEHSGNAISIYKNLSHEVSDGIVTGCFVKKGDVIGAIGETAMNEIAEEPHLHYELKVSDQHVDPKNHISFQKEENTTQNQANN